MIYNLYNFELSTDLRLKVCRCGVDAMYSSVFIVQWFFLAIIFFYVFLLAKKNYLLSTIFSELKYRNRSLNRIPVVF